MKASEAASLIREIGVSIRDRPGQFNVAVNITGQTVTSHRGTGVRITATGGGPGSKTIGQHVTAEGGGVSIVQGHHAFDSARQELVRTLGEMASELETGTPDHSKLAGLRDSLVGTWVPGIITSIVANVLSASIGLGS